MTCMAVWKINDGRGVDWSSNWLLLHNPIAVATIQSKIKQHFKLNNDCNVSEGVLWGAFKAVIRGWWIAVMVAYKKEKDLVIMDLKDKIKKLEDRHLKFGRAKTLCKLNIALSKLGLHETSKNQWKADY